MAEDKKTVTKKAPAKKAVAKKTVAKKAVKKIEVEVAKPKSTKKGNEENKLRIMVKAYEPKVLDISVKQIIDTAKRFDAEICGPIPLPIEISKYTVNRSTFIYKDAREQFEIRVHKRLIDILNPNPKLIEALTSLSLPSGVDINVKMG
ncbi:30S ribosomal protein S10 [bioreactor metagenome]|uniref:30S ribosomal protein S10 n=1 Tax=bioreactor metagenome TaxID=1076179 RepID=A0A644T6J0_9ZZZZ